MKLRRFLLRYFPPGLILEYERRDGTRNTRIIDLLQLSPETDLTLLADQLVAEEPLISESRRPQLLRLLRKLADKQVEHDGRCAAAQSGGVSTRPGASNYVGGYGAAAGPPGHPHAGSAALARRLTTGVTLSRLALPGPALAPARSEYGLFKVLRAHILPLTNCAFNKSGDRFITGSYDRTCKMWDTASGSELASLEGHKNVVYAISFNNPFG